MKKYFKILLCSFIIVLNATGWAKGQVQRYYDDSEIRYSVNLLPNVKKKIPVKFIWQLVTGENRLIAGGKLAPQTGNKLILPLKFDKLKPGIKLKCNLLIKFNRQLLVKQPLEIYSKQIFASIAGQLKKQHAGAVLPEHEIVRLNKLGMGLPEKALDGFENPANKVIFCAAKEYADNIGMLQELMKRGVTLIMFAPNDESEIFLPLGKMAKITIISANKAKSNGRLGVIYSKEKLMIGCNNGQSDLVAVKYQTGKIIIIADAVYKNLDKTPEAALMLKARLIN
ncbi:MAG: hypothetical protein L3J71_10820 [Victivallaceae bacterium]|nr:hypothetical protein [Victivallaceae bacterium]